MRKFAIYRSFLALTGLAVAMVLMLAIAPEGSLLDENTGSRFNATLQAWA